MLAVGVHHAGGRSRGPRPARGAPRPGGRRRRDLRALSGVPKSGNGTCARRALVMDVVLPCVRLVPGGVHGVIAAGSRVMIANWSASMVCHGPTVPSGHWTRTSAAVASPRPTCDQPSWPPACPPPIVTSREDLRPSGADLDPRADRVAVGAGLFEPEAQPVAHRAGASLVIPDARHCATLSGSRRLTLTRSRSPSRSKSTRAAPRPGRSRGFRPPPRRRRRCRRPAR